LVTVVAFAIAHVREPDYGGADYLEPVRPRRNGAHEDNPEFRLTASVPMNSVNI
jgi:hypothetical protein